MSEENKKWYYDNTILLGLALLIVIILYGVGVAVFINKGDEKTVGAFEAVTGVSGLILSVGTIFFVIKAYQQQKRQNEIQTDQIVLQKQQIDENKRDLEFNRALDIVYRQLEHSKEKLIATKEDFIKCSFNVNNVITLINKYQEIVTFFTLLNYENDFYLKLLKSINLEDETKEFLFRIYTSNLSYNYKHIIHRNIQIVNMTPKIKDLFDEYIYRKYGYKISDSIHIAGYADATENEQKELILTHYKKEIDEEYRTFNLFLQYVDNIDTTFKKYNVWIKDNNN